jgi:3-methylcrotonyl-CoA carboxylase beta subunit
MDRIETKIDTSKTKFQNQFSLFKDLMNQHEDIIDMFKSGGSKKARIRQEELGKLNVRERIEKLIDKDSDFLELSTLAGFNINDNQFPCAGIITGLGIIHTKDVIIIANDASVKGGTYIEETIKKHLRAQQIALENNLPCVYLVDSGGVFLPDQAKVFGDRNHFGRFFYNQARMSAVGIPQISVVMGSCTAGGAYVPAMSDETIIVKKQGTIFVGGPPLVKVATGQEVTSEELGGAEMHTSISGTADHLAEDDNHALEICRNIFETIQQPIVQKIQRKKPQLPHFSEKELYGLAPIDFRIPLKIKEIIARLVDNSEFHEFKERYAKTLITGFAHIDGFPIGVIANNGILFSESALKGAHFVQICASRGLPIIFLQNVVGFMVGKQYEQGGIARDGAKMVHAVANANVPKFTVIVGGSFGAGNYAMAGRAFDPRLLLTWPNSRISVMGGPQAASVLSLIKDQQMQRQGQNLSPKEKQKIEDEIISKYEKEGSPYYGTARIWDDGVIDPLLTRKYLSRGIKISQYKKYEQTKNGIFRM